MALIVVEKFIGFGFNYSKPPISKLDSFGLRFVLHSEKKFKCLHDSRPESSVYLPRMGEMSNANAVYFGTIVKRN